MNINPAIYIDMDGTIVDFYGFPNWLACLDAEDVSPYAYAKPFVNLSRLAYVLNKMKRMGWEVNIISWTSKTGSERFNAEIAVAKRQWLAKHLPSVKFDNIYIVPYGTPKTNYINNDRKYHYLIDDEQSNIDKWVRLEHCYAYKPSLAYHLGFTVL